MSYRIPTPYSESPWIGVGACALVIVLYVAAAFFTPCSWLSFMSVTELPSRCIEAQ